MPTHKLGIWCKRGPMGTWCAPCRRLLEAAPDLLEAARFARPRLDARGGPTKHEALEAANMLRAAIARTEER